ncbi:UDP-glucose 4-epimerase GalE [Psychromicrobium lacuslunae]|uniref:UDP-glucose 4-epimerase n=1 Tax=Psychromicrobium lacuslunae TaxID=1618207 RepID=A0A0D4BXN6_9MICC|nr:UDP-glucose 4-epimerase GalE [Psychromicrobium lacuslunae]AJT40886.1 UDP-glucose 4-epimerase [Psychromicrobium lacuslunae]
MKILVTGGAGYIGSHTVLGLLEKGHQLVVVDNLDNSSEESLRRVQELSGQPVSFHQVDLLDEAALEQVFVQESPEAVVHFAGLKAVGESVAEPLLYYRNNLIGTLHLLQSMKNHGVKKLVFSSSATVYSATASSPLIEKAELGATNPYGRTKQQIEEILSDLGNSDPEWSIALLRYFNPVGAHSSGRIGEDPSGVPNNLLPFVAQVAVGRREKVTVFGSDYPTTDGTGVRDYIHVVDLAEGHLAALEYLNHNTGVYRWNLGTGRGYSVLEVIATFQKVSGRKINYVLGDRRPGDMATSFADASAALADLSWSASRDLEEMCADHWRWQESNPQGYAR